MCSEMLTMDSILRFYASVNSIAHNVDFGTHYGYSSANLQSYATNRESPMQVRINVFELKNQLELKERRRYTVQEIAEAVGVTRRTIKEVLNNNSKGIYFDTLVGLIKFFRSRGLDVRIEDILILDEESEGGMDLAK